MGHIDRIKQDQFMELIGQNTGLIYKVCYMYAIDGYSVKDLYQEVLANLWAGIDSFNGKSKLTTWIYRVAINTCVSYHRRNDRHTGHSTIDETTPDDADDSDEHHRMLRQMYEMISRLGRLDKAVVMLWLDEYSYDEIATMTGLSRTNVATRLHRIKQKLMNDA
ncbi:MAG: sigma-70 family RNA polymerase sigma factor [Bacteroides sp.]|nr:sigma-70 family RNA polymerase sigma factor [Bacteroides sp.]MCM1412924.1 sigma-70 family RNA polymerase sigma factor [Bacteroides sp.]MCM1471593.1 sigma-70 family RNA polymerase sigma factor [Bacteroides sp.]